MISGRRRRGAAVALACAVAVVACSETRRPLGEDCLKSGDCLSGLCSGLKCAATPPLLDGTPDHADAGRDDASDDANDSASVSGDADEGG